VIRILHDTSDTALPTARADGDALWVERADVERATGWAWKPEGLCRDDTCMPLPREAERPMTDDDRLDVAALWRHAGWPVVHDDAAQIWVLDEGAGATRRGTRDGGSARLRAARSRRQDAPALRLPRPARLPGGLGVVVRVQAGLARVAVAVPFDPGLRFHRHRDRARPA